MPIVSRIVLVYMFAHHWAFIHFSCDDILHLQEAEADANMRTHQSRACTSTITGHLRQQHVKGGASGTITPL